MFVRSFDREPDLVDAFVELPFRLRASDPKWIPPMREKVRSELSTENLFFRHGRMRNFLAFDGDKVVGRCSAFVNDALEDDGAPRGLVGYFEAEDRYEVSRALLDAALGWLRGLGLRQVWGPMEFSIWHSYRFMTRGFDREPFFGEPYNPPYYPEHFLKYGFSPLARWFSWDLEELHLKFMKAAAEAMANPRFAEEGFATRNFDLANFEKELLHVYELLRGGFRDNFGFCEISFEEFRQINDGLRLLAVPDLVRIVEHGEGDSVCFGYLYPDYGPVVRKLGGEIDPAALVAARESGELDRIVFHTVVVKPEYRKRRVVETALGPLLGRVLERGARRGVGALAKEGPTIYTKTGEPAREYTIFGMSL